MDTLKNIEQFLTESKESSTLSFQLTDEDILKVDKVKKEAVIGDLDTIFSAIATDGKVDIYQRTVIQDMPAFTYEGRIFIRNDLLSKEFLEFSVQHEAVETVYQDKRSASIQFIQDLMLTDIFDASNFNSDRPEHYVARYFELKLASESGKLDAYVINLLQSTLSNIDQILALPREYPQVISEQTLQAIEIVRVALLVGGNLENYKDMLQQIYQKIK